MKIPIKPYEIQLFTPLKSYISNPIKPYEILWNPIKPYEILWNPMKTSIKSH